MSEYRNWSEAHLNNSGDCVTLWSLSKGMSTHSCSDQFPYLCFKNNLILVKQNKTWEEALGHCRDLGSGHDLVSVQPGEDQAYLLHKVMEADTEEVGSYSATSPTVDVKAPNKSHVLLIVRIYF